jgi:RecA-family ATPase
MPESERLQAPKPNFSHLLEPQKPLALEIFTAAEIDAMDLPPPDEVVPGIFIVGSTLLGAKPKIGKTYLMLGVAHAIATGGKALGHISCQSGSALLLLLEDNRRRFKKRMRQIAGDAAASLPKTLQVAFQARRINEGLPDQIRAWHAATRSAGGKPRLVVIDTLTAVRPLKLDKRNPFQVEYEILRSLTDLAHVLQIAIVIVHHMRKAVSEDILDDISGTLGLNAAVDTVIGLRKSGSGYELTGRGRDVEEFAFGLQRGNGTWTLIGSAAELQATDNSRRIIDALQERAEDGMSPSDIARETGIAIRSVQYCLARMVRDDDSIEKIEHGHYRLKASPLGRKSSSLF